MYIMKFAYSLRIDGYLNLDNKLFMKAVVEKAGSLGNLTDWIICHEKGKETGRLHFQGMLVYHDKPLEEGVRVNLRNWINRHMPKDDAYHTEFYKDLAKIQKVAFTKGRDFDRLEMYVYKERKVILTTYSQEELDAIAPWVDQKDVKNVWKECLEAIKPYKCDMDNYPIWKQQTRHAVCKIYEIHLNNGEKGTMPRPDTITKLLYRNGNLTVEEIARKGAFSDLFYD